MKTQPLPRSFYNRDPREVARELLGCLLVRFVDNRMTSGRIVETEAYLAAGDSANHAHRGRTRRNGSMFGPPGHAYVYSIHAHCCLNAVTEPEETASAVLIRAVEPLEGVDLMRQRRGVEKLLDLARGPGRLCKAFAIDRDLDGANLTVGRELWIEEDSRGDSDLITSPRIGVTSAEQLSLRFYVHNSRFVSGRRAN